MVLGRREIENNPVCKAIEYKHISFDIRDNNAIAFITPPNVVPQKENVSADIIILFEHNVEFDDVFDLI